MIANAESESEDLRILRSKYTEFSGLSKFPNSQILRFSNSQIPPAPPMRPFTSTISIDEARRLLREGVRPIERVDTVGADESPRTRCRRRRVSNRRSKCRLRALRWTATPVVVARLPHGRGIRIDLFACGLSIGSTQGRIPAHESRVPGTAIEIATCAPAAGWAPTPSSWSKDTTGWVRTGAESCSLRRPPDRDIGRRGADISSGDRVVRRGDHLNASRIGALAAIGGTSVEVFARPRVAVLSTGNEVIEPGAPLAAAQIFDVNRFTLGAVIHMHGGIAVRHASPVPDTLAAHITALDQCSSADIMIFSGGSSVGDRDLIVDPVAARGIDGVSRASPCKPGKPTAFAIVDGKPRSSACPAIPTSCLSNAYILLVPFLRDGALPLDAAHGPCASLSAPADRLRRYAASVLSRCACGDGTAYPAFKGSGRYHQLRRRPMGNRDTGR